MQKQNLKDMKKILVTVGLIVNSLVGFSQQLTLHSNHSKAFDGNFELVGEKYINTTFVIDIESQTITVAFGGDTYTFDITGSRLSNDNSRYYIDCGESHFTLLSNNGNTESIIVEINKNEFFTYSEITSFYNE
mgnify:FL=1